MTVIAAMKHSSATSTVRGVHGSSAKTTKQARYSSARWLPSSASPGESAHRIEANDHRT